jgi:hypothetical protein
MQNSPATIMAKARDRPGGITSPLSPEAARA